MDYILLLLLSLSMGALAIQIAYASTLSDKVKKVFGLTLPYKYSPLLTINGWVKILNSFNWFIFLSPIILVIILLLNFHKFIAEMVGCAYCTSYHLGWLVFYFYLGLPIIDSLILAPLCMLGVVINEKLM